MKVSIFDDCIHKETKLVRNIISNGDSQIWKKCLTCGKNINGSGFYLSHEGIDIESLPIENDYRNPENFCERCGSIDGIEIHHWAPQALFDDSNKWPIGKLCRSCHLIWGWIVTPNISDIRNKQSLIKFESVIKSLKKHKEVLVFDFDTMKETLRNSNEITQFIETQERVNLTEPRFGYKRLGWKVTVEYWNKNKNFGSFMIKPKELPF